MCWGLYAAVRHWHRAAANFGAGLFLCAACVIVSEHAVAETIKIGMLKNPSAGPVYIAQERGYFAAEGIPAELVFFNSGEPIAVAVVAGSIDFGITGTTGGFFSLASQGALRIIAGEPI